MRWIPEERSRLLRKPSGVTPGMPQQEAGPLTPRDARAPMQLARDESVAAALLAHAQRVAGASLN